MAAKFSQISLSDVLSHRAKKGTSIGNGKVKRSSMSKAQKRSHKAYRGQGK
jgi:hypothetical protein